MKNFIQCRDCKYWRATQYTTERLETYSRDENPKDGYISAVCMELLDYLDIGVSGGNWHSCSVDHIETDANFGCVFGELKDDG